MPVEKRLDVPATFTGGWFVKGYAGIGSVSQGVLHDEDFPPALTPYSNTVSGQHNGTLSYSSADLGYDVLRGGDFAAVPFFDRARVLALVERLPHLDATERSATDPVLMMALTACFLQRRFNL